jgi:hypothetical protein
VTERGRGNDRTRQRGSGEKEESKVSPFSPRKNSTKAKENPHGGGGGSLHKKIKKASKSERTSFRILFSSPSQNPKTKNYQQKYRKHHSECFNHQKSWLQGSTLNFLYA